MCVHGTQRYERALVAVPVTDAQRAELPPHWQACVDLPSDSIRAALQVAPLAGESMSVEMPWECEWSRLFMEPGIPHTHTPTHTHAHTGTHTQAHTLTHTGTHTQAHTQAHRHTQERTHAETDTHTHGLI